MVDHHWEIIPESLEGLVRKNSGQENGHMPENDRTASGQAQCPNCEWMRQHLEDQLMEKGRQLSEKDKQIEQLHILLQNCQEQVQRMLPAPDGGGGPGNSQRLISLK
jgi:hypothetical protein